MRKEESLRRKLCKHKNNLYSAKIENQHMNHGAFPPWSPYGATCEANKQSVNANTLIVDGEVVDRRSVCLSWGQRTASEMDMMGGTKNKHSPTDNNNQRTPSWPFLNTSSSHRLIQTVNR